MYPKDGTVFTLTHSTKVLYNKDTCKHKLENLPPSEHSFLVECCLKDKNSVYYFTCTFNWLVTLGRISQQNLFLAATSTFREESRNPNFETAHSYSSARTSKQDLEDSRTRSSASKSQGTKLMVINGSTVCYLLIKPWLPLFFFLESFLLHFCQESCYFKFITCSSKEPLLRPKTTRLRTKWFLFEW